jgi:hypothetical protein
MATVNEQEKKKQIGVTGEQLEEIVGKKAQIELNTKDISDIKEALENLGDVSGVAELQEQVNTIETDLEKASALAVANQHDIVSLKNKTDETNEAVESLQSRVIELEEGGSGSADLTALQENVNANTSDISDLKTGLSEHTASIEALETNLPKVYEDVTAETNEKLAPLEANIGANAEAIQKNETDILSVEKKVEDLKAQGVQQTPLFAESVEWLNENGDTSKVYVLPDGSIWGYTKGLVASKENQYNSDAAKFNSRLHPSYVGTENEPWRVCNGLVYVEIDGIDFTEKSSYIIRFNGVTVARHTNMGITGQVVFLTQSSDTPWDLTGYSFVKYTDSTGSFVFKQDDNGYYIDLMDANPPADTKRIFFGICLADNTAINAATCENLFVECVPLTTYITDYCWCDTGFDFITSDKIDKTAYVDCETGIDTNTGEKDSPLKTIQKAIDNGANLILVEMGVYDETVTIERNDIYICLRTYPNFDTSVPKLGKIQVNNMVIKNCNDITIENVEVIGNTVSAFYAKNVSNLAMVECSAHDGSKIGFELYNVNGRFSGCTAYNLDYQGNPDEHNDGFNIHGYGYTEFINCSAWNCGDDGISHHDGCTGLILGGEFYGCGKGGVSSPTTGAEITIDGAYCHDNVYGIYAVSAGSKAYIRNCVLKNNSSHDLVIGQNVLGFAWNNHYDTKSIADGFTDFDT